MQIYVNSYSGELISKGPLIRTPLMHVVFEAIGAEFRDDDLARGAVPFQAKTDGLEWKHITDHVFKAREFLGLPQSERFESTLDMIAKLGLHYNVDPDDLSMFSIRHEIGDDYEIHFKDVLDLLRTLKQDSNLSNIRFMESYNSRFDELYGSGGAMEYASPRVAYARGTHGLLLDVMAQIDFYLENNDIEEAGFTLQDEIMDLFNAIQDDEHRAQCMDRIGKALQKTAQLTHPSVRGAHDQQPSIYPGMG